MTLDQILGVIMLAMTVPIGIYLFIDNRGGLVYLDDLKRKFKKN